MKHVVGPALGAEDQVALRAGAWIETQRRNAIPSWPRTSPSVRGRGLKLLVGGQVGSRPLGRPPCGGVD